MKDNFTGLHDRDGDPINELDIVHYGDEKFNRVVRYYPQYLAFSLDDERMDRSHRWLTGASSFDMDGKLCNRSLEIRSKHSTE